MQELRFWGRVDKQNQLPMKKPYEWEKDQIEVHKLLLDNNNYRLPLHLKGLLQPQLLDALIEEYDVEDIAKSISEKGFYPHESIVVVVENKKYIVLEGNRRLAACKALLSPQNIVDNKKKKFIQYAAITDFESIKKIPVVIAPNRAEAIDLIESLHTDVGRKKWDTIAKARFDKENRSSDKGKLTEANKVLDLYAVATAIKLPDDVAAVVKSESKFNLTNLIRIANDENTKRYLGYEFGPKGNLIIKSKPQEFEAGLELLVTDVAQMKNFSRVTDKAEDRKKYIDEKKKVYAPDLSGGGKLSAEEFIEELDKKRKPADRKSVVATPSKRKVRISKNVIPHTFKCTVTHTRISRVFTEISGMPIDTFPNATGIMLRLLLEISLFQYLEDKGEIKKMKQRAIDSLKGDQRLRPHWTPELKEMLKWVADEKHDLVNGHIAKKINKMIESNSKDPVLYDLNQFVHNPEEIPEPTGLRKTWSSLEGLLNVILNPTAADGAKS